VAERDYTGFARNALDTPCAPVSSDECLDESGGLKLYVHMISRPLPRA